MVCAADNQIFYINIKGIGYIIKRFEVWLNKPFSCFLLFCEYYFKSVEISHRVKYFNHNAKLYNLSDMDTTSYNNNYQEVGIWLK